MSLLVALAMLAAMQHPLPLNTPDVVVLRADDPRARGAVERILKESYSELQPVLRTFSLVVTKKPMRMIGGAIGVVRESDSSFYYTAPLPAADAGLLVSPTVVISPAYAPDPKGVERVLALEGIYEGKVIRSGPGVDFILFADGTDWGTDTQHYRRQCREAPDLLRQLAARMNGMSGADADSFLREEAFARPAANSFLIQASIIHALTAGGDSAMGMQRWLLHLADRAEADMKGGQQ